MRKVLFAALLLLLPLCGQAKSICQIIKLHPNWYQAAETSAKKWGVPVPVQLAIIHQESDFDADAKNPRSSAFGYAQAINRVWLHYERQTDNFDQRRNSFADATNFIGWYAKTVQQQMHIDPADAYALYLAYHDGLTGYLADMHRHTISQTTANKVEYQASIYQKELISC